MTTACQPLKVWSGWEPALLRGLRRLGRPLFAFLQVTSTNDLVRRAALQGAPEGYTVVARSQTCGRGQRGRTWVSADGKGLYLSVLLRPRCAPAHGREISLWCAAAVADSLSGAGMKQVSVKHPNDVLVAGRKIAGILAESRIAGGRLAFVVVGIGLNLAQSAPDWTAYGLDQPATSCLQERVFWSPQEAARHVLNGLEAQYRLPGKVEP